MIFKIVLMLAYFWPIFEFACEVRSAIEKQHVPDILFYSLMLWVNGMIMFSVIKA